MQLVSAKVGPFKSITASQNVAIDSEVTVFVGMNEAGKTVFFQALEKSDGALGLGTFEPVDDYPRKDLPAYLKRHKTKPEEVTVLTYRPSADEIANLNKELGTALNSDFQLSVTHRYDNSLTIGIDVNEGPVLDSLLTIATLSAQMR